jgi:CheY-like chemotaxis protein
MADIILAGAKEEKYGGLIEILEAKGESTKRIDVDISDPEFDEALQQNDCSVIISRFNDGDLASIKAMQQVKLQKPYVQTIFMSDKEIPGAILTLMFNEGAFGTLLEPLAESQSALLVRQAIKKSKWDLDEIARSSELKALNKNLRSRIEHAEGEMSRSRDLIDKLGKMVHFLLSDKYFKAQKIKVLVVSSSPYQRNLMYEEFVKLGFTTEQCDSSSAALDKIQEYKPDIVVSDMEMEGMTGVELAKIVKTDPAYPHLYFVVSTSNPEKTEMIMSPDTKVDDCVIKPSDSNKYYMMVSRIVLGILEK